MPGVDFLIQGNWPLSTLIYFLAGYIFFIGARKREEEAIAKNPKHSEGALASLSDISESQILFHSVIHGAAWFIVTIPAILFSSKVAPDGADILLSSSVIALSLSISVNLIAQYKNHLWPKSDVGIIERILSNKNLIFFVLSVAVLIIAATLGNFEVANITLFHIAFFLLILIFFKIHYPTEYKNLLQIVIIAGLVLLMFAGLDDSFSTFSVNNLSTDSNTIFSVVNSGQDSAIISKVDLWCNGSTKTLTASCLLPQIVEAHGALVVRCTNDINFLLCDLSKSRVTVNNFDLNIN